MEFVPDCFLLPIFRRRFEIKMFDYAYTVRLSSCVIRILLQSHVRSVLTVLHSQIPQVSACTQPHLFCLFVSSCSNTGSIRDGSCCTWR